MRDGRQGILDSWGLFFLVKREADPRYPAAAMAWEVPGWLKALGISGERLSRLRLAQGVVGRTTLALIVVVLVVGGIGWRLAGVTALLLQVMLWALALGVIGLFVLYFLRIMRFADANPMAATLEGSEWIQLEQLRLAAKGLPDPPHTPLMVDPRGEGRALPPAGGE